MSSILQAAVGNLKSKKITTALLSVSDKTDLIPFASFLVKRGVTLLSTGGTAKLMRSAGLTVMDVSEYTKFPEMMNGRVKTLHPKIHGGLLGVRGNESHEKDMKEHDIENIDLVVMNLYAFEKAVASGENFDTCIENIDIGGPSMLRSAAKNHSAVTICTQPEQYQVVMEEMEKFDGETSLELRRKLAAAAFLKSAKYDTAISNWFAKQLSEQDGEKKVQREYHHELSLKYGCNPQQKPAAIYRLGVDGKLPFSVENGAPGYINLLDAVNAYQLVKELKQAIQLPAAASFKHVSPAGAAVALPLDGELHAAYEVGNAELTPLSLAYIRARNADPLSSFGDFVAVSDVVDEATAKVLKREVSDGIIAPGYEDAALEILKAKKGGKFIVLKADPTFAPPDMEYRECYGMAFAQKRNDVQLTYNHVSKLETNGKPLSKEAQTDLLLAAITLKYTQSNSVGYAKNGQMIGVGAGQQSRVDCVKLAGRKVAVWHLRQHPKVQNLEFKKTTKRQDRVNARVRYIEGDMAAPERKEWEALLETIPEPLTADEKSTAMSELSGVGLASDAFFPFRDSIDHAAKMGVSYVSQPGGSNRDAEVISACEEYDISMSFSGTRLFHH